MDGAGSGDFSRKGVLYIGILYHHGVRAGREGGSKHRTHRSPFKASWVASMNSYIACQGGQGSSGSVMLLTVGRAPRTIAGD